MMAKWSLCRNPFLNQVGSVREVDRLIKKYPAYLSQSLLKSGRFGPWPDAIGVSPTRDGGRNPFLNQVGSVEYIASYEHHNQKIESQSLLKSGRFGLMLKSNHPKTHFRRNPFLNQVGSVVTARRETLNFLFGRNPFLNQVGSVIHGAMPNVTLYLVAIPS